jgi:hypothetical protein
MFYVIAACFFSEDGGVVFCRNVAARLPEHNIARLISELYCYMLSRLLLHGSSITVYWLTFLY